MDKTKERESCSIELSIDNHHQLFCVGFYIRCDQIKSWLVDRFGFPSDEQLTIFFSSSISKYFSLRTSRVNKYFQKENKRFDERECLCLFFSCEQTLSSVEIRFESNFQRCCDSTPTSIIETMLSVSSLFFKIWSRSMVALPEQRTRKCKKRSLKWYLNSTNRTCCVPFYEMQSSRISISSTGWLAPWNTLWHRSRDRSASLNEIYLNSSLNSWKVFTETPFESRNRFFLLFWFLFATLKENLSAFGLDVHLFIWLIVKLNCESSDGQREKRGTRGNSFSSLFSRFLFRNCFFSLSNKKRCSSCDSSWQKFFLNAVPNIAFSPSIWIFTKNIFISKNHESGALLDFSRRRSWVRKSAENRIFVFLGFCFSSRRRFFFSVDSTETILRRVAIEQRPILSRIWWTVALLFVSSEKLQERRSMRQQTSLVSKISGAPRSTVAVLRLSQRLENLKTRQIFDQLSLFSPNNKKIIKNPKNTHRPALFHLREKISSKTKTFSGDVKFQEKEKLFELRKSSRLRKFSLVEACHIVSRSIWRILKENRKRKIF